VQNKLELGKKKHKTPLKKTVTEEKNQESFTFTGNKASESFTINRVTNQF
jgi:hypothetical protein